MEVNIRQKFILQNAENKEGFIIWVVTPQDFVHRLKC